MEIEVSKEFTQTVPARITVWPRGKQTQEGFPVYDPPLFFTLEQAKKFHSELGAAIREAEPQ